MKIITVGYDFRHGSDFAVSRPLGLNEYLFLIIRSTALFEINGQKLHIKPDSMILIDKNTPHSFCADSEIFINDWIAFTLDESEHLSHLKNIVNFNTFFTSPDASLCSDIIKLICTEKNSSSIFRESNLQNMLQVIFNKLRDNFKACKTDIRYHNELQKVRNKIYANPCKKFTIEKLAAEINLSKSYFQHCYKECFNTTPIADVINSRIEYSKQLLMSTSFSISKISDIIGYQNDIQFIKQFKAVVKTTPAQYRKKVTSDYDEVQ